MALPTLTPEQRADALEKAAEARKKRAELKGELKSGKRTLADVLQQADGDDTVGQDEGVERARVAARRRQGARPEDRWRSSTSPPPAASAVSGPSSASMLLERFGKK